MNAKMVAQKIIDNLTGRRGFDAMWDDCDEDVRTEIIESITKIIAAPAAASAQEVVAQSERVAQLVAHRACHNQEQDIENGKLAGYCIVCGVPWPCAYAGTPPAAPASAPVAEEVTWPDEFGSMYVRLRPMADGCVKQTRQIQANADYDADRNLLGVEILDAHMVAPPAPVPEEAAKDERQSEAYPRCTEILRHSGKPYPRTCQECGLGPCKRKSPAPVQASELVQRLRYEAEHLENAVKDCNNYGASHILADGPEGYQREQSALSWLKEIALNTASVANEAAAAIECRGEVGEWISVDDKLPKRNELVLVCAKDFGTVHCLMHYSEPRWFIGQTDASYDWPITHWRPLPAHPAHVEGGK